MRDGIPTCFAQRSEHREELGVLVPFLEDQFSHREDGGERGVSNIGDGQKAKEANAENHANKHTTATAAAATAAAAAAAFSNYLEKKNLRAKPGPRSSHGAAAAAAAATTTTYNHPSLHLL